MQKVSSLFVLLGLLSLCVPALAQTAQTRQLLAVNEAFNKALLDKDTDALKAIYADSCVIVGASGMKITGSNQLIGLVKNGLFYYKRYALTATETHSYANAGVVTGVLDATVFAFGQTNQIHERYTANYQQQASTWKLTAIQYTIIEDEPAKSIAAVSKIHESFRQALLKSDTTALSAIYTPDFTLTTPTGQLVKKDDLLKAIASGQSRFTQLAYEQTGLRSYGPVVVITSLVNFNAIRQGAERQGTERYTGTYVKTGGEWHLAAMHFSTPERN